MSIKNTNPDGLEVLPDPPEPMDILAIIFSGKGKFGEEIIQWSDELLALEINAQASQASDFFEAAIENANLALLSAWICGSLLNTAKARFRFGRFGKWRDLILDGEIIKVRTSQRYMLIAKKFPDVEALLNENLSLRQAHLACSQSPQIPKIEKPDSGNVEDANKQALLSSVTGYRKKLDSFAVLKGRLGKDEKHQLRMAKAAIDEFFAAILG